MKFIQTQRDEIKKAETLLVVGGDIFFPPFFLFLLLSPDFTSLNLFLLFIDYD